MMRVRRDANHLRVVGDDDEPERNTYLLHGEEVRLSSPLDVVKTPDYLLHEMARVSVWLTSDTKSEEFTLFRVVKNGKNLASLPTVLTVNQRMAEMIRRCMPGHYISYQPGIIFDSRDASDGTFPLGIGGPFAPCFSGDTLSGKPFAFLGIDGGWSVSIGDYSPHGLDIHADWANAPRAVTTPMPMLPEA